MFKNVENPSGISYVALQPTRRTKTLCVNPELAGTEPDWEWEYHLIRKETKVLRVAFFIMAACAIISELTTALAVHF